MTNSIESKTANEVICATLSDAVKTTPDLVVLTSDSRGSAGMTSFISDNPANSIETGIAEQNLVTVAAGLAHAHKRPFVFSPAAFLTMRSVEQVKVDVAYSKTNVKLIGISGGNSYSNLGTTHHSLQDLAITCAIPNLEVYTPADQFETRALLNYLIHSKKPAYVRVGKRKLDNCYPKDWSTFVPGKANILRNGADICLISAGETLFPTLQAASILATKGIEATVVDLVSIKPLDTELLHKLAQKFNLILSVEEHSIINGIGAQIATIIAQHAHAKLKILGFPDEPAISGTQDEVFAYYGLDAESIAQKAILSLKG
ncbi:transketolase family protein [Ligilactobacillus sp. WILCCON 0076]|uniref:Transketolase family protein n=1 Tax=Ligilactobacillus ubinensis TaxID=2876789 RepID=A0A9X2FM81_9LACO|nr:transketolase C-terminal domain-containing protein [Ligilactobacillus ubinensis]MCP0887048.1 transketolase family protein [Ligilactobacillus ubinensis]